MGIREGGGVGGGRRKRARRECLATDLAANLHEERSSRVEEAVRKEVTRDRNSRWRSGSRRKKDTASIA